MIHIAICEDDPIYLHELEKTIKETKGLSAEIHPCSSPEERSKLYDKNSVPYDIVLMDIELPEKSGIILSKEILQSHAGYIADVDSYIEDIYLRESQGQTGIGHYVAIPHGKSDSVTQVGIAIGKVQDEIEWETLDGKGVKLIFLFAVGNDNENAKTHLRLLAEVARTLGNDDAVEALLNAGTVEDLKAVFA